jgi:RNA polymerase sigma-70 factor (ECF subfamily)
MDFERLANRHRDAVYAQMVRVCGNHDDAEDTLVEALVAAYRAMPHLRDEEAFRGWLAKIGRRVCFRLKHRPELGPLVELADLRPGPEEEAASRQMKGCLLQAVAELPPLYQEVYVRRDVRQLSAEETAAELGLSVAAVKSRLHRARRMMRDALEKSLCADESFSPVSASG